MKRIDKKVLTLIMDRPRTPEELKRETGWTATGLQAAINRLQSTRDILFDGKRYYVNPNLSNDEKPISKIVLKNNVLVEERGEGLLSPAVIVEDKPIAEWLKNPPQPLPRRLREPKTRKRDR